MANPAASDASAEEPIRVLAEEKTERFKSGRSYRVAYKRKPYVILVLKDDQDTILKDVRYRLQVGDEHFSGKTDSEGRLKEKVPEDAKEGLLRIWFEDGAEDGDDPEPIEYTLAFTGSG